MHNPSELAKVMRQAECIASQAEVQAALSSMAERINRSLVDQNPLVMAVLTGGIVTCGQLLPQLSFPCELDYVHASRYQGETRGSELVWRVQPSQPVTDRVVLLVDDIHDEGITLKALVEHFTQAGARAVYTAALVNKQHDRKVDLQLDFCGLQAPDRYLFGMGMDYHGQLRNTQAIYAVQGL